MMKNKPELDEDHHHDLEILKAVAQAWHNHSSSSKTATEFDAHRINFKANPTRFKLEAMKKSPVKDTRGAHQDFRESLWDSCEIVAVSKLLETGLGLEHQFPMWDDPSMRYKRPKESKNSLRNLFNQMSSRRFSEEDIPRDEMD